MVLGLEFRSADQTSTAVTTFVHDSDGEKMASRTPCSSRWENQAQTRQGACSGAQADSLAPQAAGLGSAVLALLISFGASGNTPEPYFAFSWAKMAA